MLRYGFVLVLRLSEEKKRAFCTYAGSFWFVSYRIGCIATAHVSFCVHPARGQQLSRWQDVSIYPGRYTHPRAVLLAGVSVGLVRQSLLVMVQGLALADGCALQDGDICASPSAVLEMAGRVGESQAYLHLAIA